MFDIQTAATSLERKQFIAEFLRFATRRKAGREMVQGWQVKKGRNGEWTMVQTQVTGSPAIPARDVDSLYEAARRGPLAYYVRDAEELRSRAYEIAGR